MRLPVVLVLVGLLATSPAVAQAPAVPAPPVEPAPAADLPRFDLVGRLLDGVRTAGLRGRWYLVPSLSLTEEYDSNIFGTASNRESDFITRPAAGLAINYVTDQVSLVAGLAVQTEFFAKNSDLNDTDVLGLGALDFRYPVSPRLNLGFSGAYSKTESVVDIRRETGVTAVEVGREDISVVRASASASYVLDPRTTGDAGYTFTYTEVSGEASDTEHSLNLAVARRFTQVDSGLLRYIFQYFDSDEFGSEVEHTVRVGYARVLGPRTRVSVELGPQISGEGEATASAAASLSHQLRQASLLLSYTREQDIVVGLGGSRTVDTLAASVGFQPIRFLNAGLAASASRISDVDDPGARDTTVYSLLATASYPLARWLTGRGTYRFSYDDNSQGIPRHVLTLTLEFAYPILLR
jgi:Putative beta-barrel porin 2